MQAAVLHAARDLRLEEVNVPQPGPGELLLEVETVGVCGTDASEYDHGPILFPLERRHPVTGHAGPLIPGHELSGRVVRMGPGVERFTEGDLVASAGSASCGECRFCVTGRSSRCDRYWAVGLHRDGALAGYCTVPAAACVSVGPLGITSDAAALAQPMAIAVHALRRGGITGAEEVLVIGAGGIGSFVTYAAAAAGCAVTTVDLDPDRLVTAAALGATTTTLVDPDAAVDGLEAEVVFEITGSVAGLRTGLGALVPCGRLVAVGFQRTSIELDLAALTTNELEWVGSNGIDTAIDLPEAARLLAGRATPWTDVAPTVLPLGEVEMALKRMTAGAKGPIKTLISPKVEQGRPALM